MSNDLLNVREQRLPTEPPVKISPHSGLDQINVLRIPPDTLLLEPRKFFSDIYREDPLQVSMRGPLQVIEGAPHSRSDSLVPDLRA
jgi:hypothetical protein